MSDSKCSSRDDEKSDIISATPETQRNREIQRLSVIHSHLIHNAHVGCQYCAAINEQSISTTRVAVSLLLTAAESVYTLKASLHRVF